MDVIKVSETRLVVHMTGEDMTKYRISTEEMEAFGAAARGALRRVLKKAAADSGFVCGGKISVQVFSSKEGGCEMFVTSISHNLSFSEKDHYLHTVSKYVYRFPAIDALLTACRALKTTDVVGGSAAFADLEKKGRCFLVLEDEAPELCEFGAKKLSERDGITCYLSEHCRKICDNAVTTLGELG